MKKIIVICISLLGFASACEKEDDPVITPMYGVQVTAFQQKHNVSVNQDVAIPIKENKENEKS
ncbi:MAG: hypothetical protein WCZ21_06795 [Bacteroidales bacterium]|jgi:hypothetical protein